MQATTATTNSRRRPHRAPTTFHTPRVMLAMAALPAIVFGGAAHAQQIDWISSNGNFCTPGNWNLNTVPGVTHDAYFGRSGSSAPQVWLDCSQIIANATMLGGTTFRTNGHQLIVLGQTWISESAGNQSFLYVNPLASNPASPAFITTVMQVQNGAVMQLFGSRADIDQHMEIGGNSTLQGHGTLAFFNNSQHLSLNNNGRIRPSGGDLLITVPGNAFVDLDGDSESGELRLTASGSSLAIEGKLKPSDPFSGVIEITSGNTLSLNQPFESNGELVMRSVGTSHSRFHSGGFRFVSGASVEAPSGLVFLNGPYAKFAAGSSIDVAANGTLNISATDIEFASSATAGVTGRLMLNGHTSFMGNTITGDGYLFQQKPAHAISGFTNINMPGGVYDWDGTNETATTTINANATLALNVASIDYDGTQRFDGTIINRGTLAVNTPGTWMMNGVLNLQRLATSEPLPRVTGSNIDLLGRVEGTGAFESLHATVTGEIAPGGEDAAGQIEFVFGNVVLAGEASLNIEIGGSTPVTQHDRLRVANALGQSQTLNLGGTLRISRMSGLSPKSGQQYTIIEAHTISGQFHTVDAPGFDIEVITVAGSALDKVVAIWQGLDCPADINSDGVVNVSDLLAVIAAWGSTGENAADISPPGGDGIVNVSDLLAVIAAWGNCS